ncbi:unnamed protein product, partial [Discosporangium mesarthrocarpum]
MEATTIDKWRRSLGWCHATYTDNGRDILERAGLEPGNVDVLAFSQSTQALSPTYILAIDHTHKELVLSVRGTKDFRDTLASAHFKPEPFLDGYAHRGFVWSAQALLDEVGPRLEDMSVEFPLYR